MSDGEDDDDQPPQRERQRERSRSREREHPHVHVPQEPAIQSMVTQELDDEFPDEDFTNVDSSPPSAGPLSSAEQGNRSRRAERVRSRERVHPASSNNLLCLLQQFSRTRQLRAQMKIQQLWIYKIV